jgi:hypothetical protein
MRADVNGGRSAVGPRRAESLRIFIYFALPVLRLPNPHVTFILASFSLVLSIVLR